MNVCKKDLFQKHRTGPDLKKTFVRVYSKRVWLRFWSKWENDTNKTERRELALINFKRSNLLCVSFANNDGLHLTVYRLVQIIQLPIHMTIRHYTVELKKKAIIATRFTQTTHLRLTQYPRALIFKISVFVFEKNHQMLTFQKVMRSCALLIVDFKKWDRYWF